MESALQTIVIALTTGTIVALVNNFLVSSQKRTEEERQLKLSSYSMFLDNARAFIDDPNLSKEERRKSKKIFLEKYYNEIILFANNEIQEKVESFINTGGVAKAEEGIQVKKLKDMIKAIRKDLGFNTELHRDFKLYTLDIGGERD